MKYYCDGSSTIGVSSAFIVTDDKGSVVILEQTLPKDDGTPTYYTNNEEEYRAVIAALKICKEGDEVLTDSLLVVNQINGTYKVKQTHLLPLRDEAKKLADEKQVLIRWTPREKNLAGKHFE